LMCAGSCMTHSFWCATLISGFDMPCEAGSHPSGKPVSGLLLNPVFEAG
jgi:hypothetical protein